MPILFFLGELLTAHLGHVRWRRRSVHVGLRLGSLRAKLLTFAGTLVGAAGPASDAATGAVERDGFPVADVRVRGEFFLRSPDFATSFRCR